MSGTDKKRAALKERQRLIQAGWDQALQTPHGRAMIWDLLEQCGVFRASFNAQSPHLTSFGEGMRWIGNGVIARLLRSHPTAFASLLMEHSERVENERRRGNPTDGSAGDAGDGDASTDTD